MFNLGFNNKYKIVHICNELGENVIGGAGTYLMKYIDISTRIWDLCMWILIIENQSSL